MCKIYILFIICMITKPDNNIFFGSTETVSFDNGFYDKSFY